MAGLRGRGSSMAIYRGIVRGVFGTSEEFQYTQGFEVDSGGNAAAEITAIATWATAALTGGGTGTLNYYYTDTTWTRVTVQELDPATSLVLSTAETSINISGLQAGAPLPRQIAVVVSQRTATPGPKGRGRSYWPAPAVSSVAAGGAMSSAFQTALLAALNTAYNGYNTAARRAVVLSGNGGTSLVARPITLIQVGNIFDTQRRRRTNLVESRLSFIPDNS